MSKSASIPFLWIDPELRRAAEQVLHDGESLSAFVEHALQGLIDSRGGQMGMLTGCHLQGGAALDAALDDRQAASDSRARS